MILELIKPWCVFSMEKKTWISHVILCEVNVITWQHVKATCENMISFETNVTTQGCTISTCDTMKLHVTTFERFSHQNAIPHVKVRFSREHFSRDESASLIFTCESFSCVNANSTCESTIHMYGENLLFSSQMKRWCQHLTCDLYTECIKH